MGWFVLDDVAWLAIALATVAGFVIGAAWYHERVLGAVWMRLVGVSEEDLRAASPLRYLATGVVVALTAIVLNVLMVQLGVESAGGGALLGAFLGLVFRLGNHVIHNGFELRSHTLTLVNGFHDMAALAAAGAIIGAFL